MRQRPDGRAALVALVALITLVAVVLPLGGAIVRVVMTVWDGEVGSAAVPAGIALRSVGAALAIAFLATACAWPVALAARSLPRRAQLLMVLPLVLPSYLAYSAWGLLRAPGTPIGDWLMRGPGTGANPWPVTAGYIQGIVGLTLWSWPLAALVLVPAVRSIDQGILDSLRMETRSPVRRQRALLGLARRGVFFAIATVALVMLGSAVPLHLAQIDTLSVHVWRLLGETPAQDHGRVWLAAWPLLVIAAIAGWIAGGRFGEGAPTEPARAGLGQGGSAPALCGAGAVWVASVVAPVALFAMSLRSARSLGTFWRVSGRAMLDSGTIAALAGVGGLVIACAVWLAVDAGGAHARIARLCTRLLLIAGLVPGVLVGSATAWIWNQAAPAVGESIAVVALGHTARFGFVAALTGLWLASNAAQRDLTRLDGADTFLGWFRATLPPHLGTLAAAGIAVAVLSFHEIEAAVVLQPAGVGSFARVMLEQLHFARMEDLAAGVLYTTGLAVAGAAAVYVLVPGRERL